MRKVGKIDSRGKPRVRTVNDMPSMTVQSDAHLADISSILAQFGVEGQGKLDDVEMEFGDVSDFGDYHDIMMEVRRADETFMSLPSKVREIFGHSVENWLDTAHDDDKRAALVEAGFIKAVESVPAGVPAGATQPPGAAAPGTPETTDGSPGPE